MKNNTTNDNNGTMIQKEMSLEELDILCRQYNHLHDEEIIRIIFRFFAKVSHFFNHDKHHHYHPSAS